MPKKKRFDSESKHQDTTGKKYHDGPAPGAAKPKPVLWESNPEDPAVRFPENPRGIWNFDFAPWYDGRIDAVTRACQQVIAGMVEARTLAPATVVNNCWSGLRYYLDFCRLWSAGLERPMSLRDITREHVEGFIRDLLSREISYTSARHCFTHTKPVLTALQRHGWIDADADIFPRNPFPNSNRRQKGQKPLSTAERHHVVSRLKSDLATIEKGDESLTSDELVVCMLGIAVRSGINPVPLMELPTYCIQSHPIKHDRRLLVSYKRRGRNTHVQPLRQTNDLTLLQTVMMDVDAIVDLVQQRNAEVRAQSAQHGDRLFVHMSRQWKTKGEVRPVTSSGLGASIRRWVKRHDLRDDSGQPLKLNVMRLRKTFENRIWTLSGQDPIVTAKLGGHSLKVSNDHYLEAPPEAEKDFRLLGEVLTRELLDNPKVAAMPAENTPVARCRDSLQGQFAPHKSGEHCSNFLACVRCRSFLVTGEDLFRLFSFYWLLVHERDHIGARKWARYFAHIIRIIDRDIAPKFPAEVVDAARQKAKDNPHPFWRTRDQLEGAL